MHIDLGENRVGDDAPAILDDGGGGLVAGGLQRQDAQVLLLQERSQGCLDRKSVV